MTPSSQSLRRYSCVLGVSLKVPFFAGIDVSQHDIRFVEDNWESPVMSSCLGVNSSPFLFLDCLDVSKMVAFL